jgi:hypothetical protein
MKSGFILSVKATPYGDGFSHALMVFSAPFI